MVTIPYAFSNKLHELLHISEAFSGMHGYYCPSCEMEMGARKGKKNEHHFYHIINAKNSCEISFWVSVRSMALQILDQCNMIALPKASCFLSNSAYTPIRPIKRVFPYDRSFMAFNTVFHVLFTTPEISTNRYSLDPKITPNKYLYQDLILEIDLGKFTDYETKKQHEYLKDIIIHSLETKSWFTPSSPISNIQKDYDKKRAVENERTQTKYPFLKKLGLNKYDLTEHEENLLSRAISYWRGKDFDIYSNKTIKKHFNILDRQKYFGAYYVNHTTYCYFYFRGIYILYTLNNYSEFNTNLIFNSIKDIDTYLSKLAKPLIKQQKHTQNKYIESIENESVKNKKPLILDIYPDDMSKNDLIAYERIPRFTNRLQADCIPSNNTYNLTWVYEGNQLYLLCYKYEFFFMANIAGSIVLYKLIDNKINYLSRSYSEEEMIENMEKFLEKKLDEEAENLF